MNFRRTGSVPSLQGFLPRCNWRLRALKRRAALAIYGTVGLLAVLAASALAYDTTRNDMIADGVTVAGVDVGGLSRSSAEKRLSEQLAARLERPVSVRVAGRRFRLSSDRAAMVADVEAMADDAVDESRGGARDRGRRIASRFARAQPASRHASRCRRRARSARRRHARRCRRRSLRAAAGWRRIAAHRAADHQGLPSPRCVHVRRSLVLKMPRSQRSHDVRGCPSSQSPIASPQSYNRPAAAFTEENHERTQHGSTRLCRRLGGGGRRRIRDRARNRAGRLSVAAGHVHQCVPARRRHRCRRPAVRRGAGADPQAAGGGRDQGRRRRRGRRAGRRQRQAGRLHDALHNDWISGFAEVDKLFGRPAEDHPRRFHPDRALHRRSRWCSWSTTSSRTRR